ncbi:GntR family transcriptional regulator [Streptomyces sp. ST2-7A]|uniref:GntR family transcriptional regulator n=1 Tax=Streptomyces sp. ST2-7A TaxID=2907214 RepID=UPI001F3D055C|nr:GntR family transcriptional regulator [Streptomyces sp. ST2-7A]MCE7081603.1 GntR family transcriptional regulator [Streptomyces sp. ST2-7A]
MGDTRPVYQRIADDLRRQIDEGVLPVGARIPSRSELKRVYGASDQTVDRAVRVLKAAGYAVGQFGRGVFVGDRKPIGSLVRGSVAIDSPLAAELRGGPRVVARAGALPPPGAVGARPGPFPAVPPSAPVAGRDGFVGGGFAEGFGLLPAPRAESPAERAPHLVWEATSTATVAPPVIAERLGIGTGERVMCTRYEYLADRLPLQLATSWEPLALTGETDICWPERGPYARRGVRGRFAAIGIRVVRAREVVASRPATSPEAEALGCAPGQCLTAVERTHYAADGRPVETSDSVVRGDRWRLEYEIPLAPEPAPPPPPGAGVVAGAPRPGEHRAGVPRPTRRRAPAGGDEPAGSVPR